MTIIDAREPRSCLGHFATGVTVVSCVGDDGQLLFAAEQSGSAAAMTGFAEQRMAESDLGGWTAPDPRDTEYASIFPS